MTASELTKKNHYEARPKIYKKNPVHKILSDQDFRSHGDFKVFKTLK